MGMQLVVYLLCDLPPGFDKHYAVLTPRDDEPQEEDAPDLTQQQLQKITRRYKDTSPAPWATTC